MGDTTTNATARMLTTCALLLVATLVAAPGSAQEPDASVPVAAKPQDEAVQQRQRLVVSEQEKVLRFHVRAQQTETRTLLVRVLPAADAPELTLRWSLSSDLIGKDGATILRDQVTVSSKRSDSDPGEHLVTVRFQAGETLGSFTSQLVLELVRNGRQLSTLAVPLQVEISDVPELALAEAQAPPLLEAVLPWDDLPGFGMPVVGSGWRATGQLYLVSRSRAEARVTQASVLRLHDAEGHDLPGGTLKVASELPLVVPGGGSGRLDLAVDGYNLPAGEFNGKLLLSLDEPPAPDSNLEVGVRVRIKHGPTVPLLVLGVGIVVGWFLAWWKGEGKERSQLLAQLDRLNDHVQTAKLPEEEHNQVLSHLDEAYRAFTAGNMVETRAAYEQAKKLLDETRQKLETVLGQLNDLASEVEQLEHVETLKKQLLEKIDGIRSRIEQGEMRQLSDADSMLEQHTSTLEKLQRLLAEAADLDPRRISQLVVAKSVDEVARAIKGTQRGVSYAAVQPAAIAPARGQRDLLSSTRTRLSLSRLLVPISLYLFTLAVGWVTLYVSSATFGADPSSYLTLFLWGSVAETIRGRAMTFKELHTELKTAPA